MVRGTGGAAPPRNGLAEAGADGSAEALAAQAEIIAFLSSGAAFGVAPGDVAVRQTHCAIVFLVGEEAWKMKRAIRFAAVDYVAPARRAAACRAEIVLNRRTAPDLYLRVATITREADGALALDGAGAPVEWLVMMRRFDEDGLFDRLLARDRMDAVLAGTLGDVVGRFHAEAAPAPAHGGLAGLAALIGATHAYASRHPRLLDPARARLVRDRGLAALEAAAPALSLRRARGLVRHGHGDLRLANICLWRGRPLVFDCVDFDPDIPKTDVLFDLAFLLVDFVQAGRGDLGRAMLVRHLAHGHQPRAAEVLPIFVSMRAAMRSFAHAEAVGRQPDPLAANARAAAARADLQLAVSALGPSPPRDLAMLLGCFGEDA